MLGWDPVAEGIALKLRDLDEQEERALQAHADGRITNERAALRLKQLRELRDVYARQLDELR